MSEPAPADPPPSSSGSSSGLSSSPDRPSEAKDGLSIRFSPGTAAVLALVIVFLGIMFGPTLWREWQDDKLRQVGTRAVAQIRDIRPTGNSHNDQPEVRITLDVDDGKGEHFDAEVTTYMSPVYLPRYQPGAKVDVYYDPKDRRRVAMVEP